MRSFQLAAIAAAFASIAVADFPSCGQDCISQGLTGFNGDINKLCADQGKRSALKDCLAKSSCSSGDQGTINSYIDTNCGSVLSSTFTTGTHPAVTNGPGGSWNPTAKSAFNSYTSAHPSGWNSADYSSFTSAYGAIPTGSWGGSGSGGWGGGSWGGFGGGGGGGYGFPGFGMGPGGWSPSMGGPFGGSNGWGPFGQGSWTTCAWTSWWNGNSCPDESWSGWTSGSWSTNAPWTTWTACSAKTTAASTYTTTSGTSVITATSFGYQVAQAQQTGSTSSSGGSNSAAGAVGVPGKTVAMGAAVIAFVGALVVA